jgi:hypothetical protein
LLGGHLFVGSQRPREPEISSHWFIAPFLTLASAEDFRKTLRRDSSRFRVNRRDFRHGEVAGSLRMFCRDQRRVWWFLDFLVRWVKHSQKFVNRCANSVADFLKFRALGSSWIPNPFESGKVGRPQSKARGPPNYETFSDPQTFYLANNRQKASGSGRRGFRLPL